MTVRLGPDWPAGRRRNRPGARPAACRHSDDRGLQQRVHHSLDAGARSLLGVASIGQTLVVLIGGVDLSTPFLIGFANVVAAQLYGDGVNFALVCLIVGVCACDAAMNGALS